jgi:hypothetical protein
MYNSTPKRRRADKNALTEDIMAMHRDFTRLIDECRQKWGG